MRFYELALKDPTSCVAQDFATEAANWVVGDDGTGVIKGRMKFCRPVLRAVYKVDQYLAVTVFGSKKEAFHPIARKMIEKVQYLNFLYSSEILIIVFRIWGWSNDEDKI